MMESPRSFAGDELPRHLTPALLLRTGKGPRAPTRTRLPRCDQVHPSTRPRSTAASRLLEAKGTAPAPPSFRPHASSRASAAVVPEPHHKGHPRARSSDARSQAPMPKTLQLRPRQRGLSETARNRRCGGARLPPVEENSPRGRALNSGKFESSPNVRVPHLPRGNKRPSSTRRAQPPARPSSSKPQTRCCGAGS